MDDSIMATLFVTRYNYAFVFQRSGVGKEDFCLVVETPFPESLTPEYLLNLHAFLIDDSLVFQDDKGEIHLIYVNVPLEEGMPKLDAVMLLHPEIEGFISFEIEQRRQDNQSG